MNNFFKEWSDLITGVAAFAITMIAIVVANRDYQKRKIEETKQKSVGEEALNILKKEIELMKEKVQKGEMNTESFKKVLERLTDDYDFLMKRFFEFFKPSRKASNED